MSGLISKALDLKKRLTVDTTLWGSDSLDKIDPGERAEIVGRIDKLLAARRIRIRPDRFAVKARKRSLLPVLVNVGALVGIVGGSAVLYLSFNRQEQALVIGAAEVASTEGRLIEAIRRESEQKLAAKDGEILAAQQKLEEARQERQKLGEENAARIASREKELRAEFAVALEAERRRLVAAGVTGADLDGRLRAYEDQKRSEFDAAVKSFREQVDQQAAAREAAIAAVTRQYEATLASVQGQRQALEGELARRHQELAASAHAREQELTADARAREQELTTDRARIAAELAGIAAQQEKERLALDQILSFYDRVNRDLSASRYPQALEGLAGLRRLLDQPQVASLPAVARRRSVEVFIIESLSQLIEARSAPLPDTSAAVAAAEALARAGALVERGNRRFAGGDVEGARTLYDAGLREIPQIQGGYARLREIEDLAAKAEARRVAGLIGEADRSYERGEFQASIDKYREAMRALGRSDPAIDRVVGRIADAGFRVFDSRRQAEEQAAQRELLARLSRARAAAAAVPESAPADPVEVSQLLQAKLLVRQIIGSESVRAQYPELYDTMQRYFDVLADQRAAEGRQAALSDAVVLVEAVSGTAGLRPAAGDGERQLLLRLLDSLAALLQ